MPEPMHGFGLPLSSFKRIGGSGKKPDSYFNDGTAPHLRDKMSKDRARLAKRNSAFGDFVLRENVRSCARLRHFSSRSDQVQAVLWINFGQPQQFKRTQRGALSGLRDKLVNPAILEDIIKRWAVGQHSFVSQLVRILQPPEQIPTAGHPLDPYLDRMLNAILDTFNIPLEAGLGTIHLYDPNTHTLRMAAQKGLMDPEAPRVQDVREGEGIISWVALTRRSILISNLQSAETRRTFGSIHKAIAPGITSELAVPMLAGEDFCGVLNLESTRDCQFTDQDVRTLWFAANQAAIACRLCQQASVGHQKLLKITHDITSRSDAGRPVLDLAKIARDWLRAQHSDIWQYRDGRWIVVGASYGHHPSPLPRENGWSEYVRQTKVPVWIYEVGGSVRTFKSRFWHRTAERWEEAAPSHESAPTEVNKHLLHRKVQCELGLPIEVEAGRCIGVAWLKYLHKVPEPTPSTMSEAFGFAGHAGLVMEILYRHEKSVDRARILQDYLDKLFRRGSFSFPGMQGFVLRNPHGEFGGDFHALQPIDDCRTGILVGDATGHGDLGALRMLPMITTFKHYSKMGLSSAKDALLRLLPICHELDLTGSAICLVVDVSDRRKPLLFSASAGHPPLIVVRHNRRDFDFPESIGLGNVGSLGVEPFGTLAEAVLEPSSGDLVIAYTDGVKEAGPRGRQFGRNGIARVAEENFDASPEQIARAIEETAMACARLGSEDDKDDMTIVVLRLD